MKRVLVRYKINPGQGSENRQYVEKVFAELAAKSPEGIRYATFVLEDGVSFVHIASVETADGSNPLTQTDAFKAFQAGLKDRCEEPPHAVTLEEVGAYRLFGS